MASVPKVLVTAFEPFGGDAVNASERAVLPLAGRTIAGHEIVVRILPCRFGESAERMRALLAEVRPRVVMACGEASDRGAISLERVAINVDDARIADNAGERPIDRPIEPGGPVACWSTLPLKPIGRALTERGIPAAMSQTAGTFVCNHVFYALMRALEATPDVRGGFVHVPRTPAQSRENEPSMPTERVTEALAIAIETILAAP